MFNRSAKFAIAFALFTTAAAPILSQSTPAVTTILKNLPSQFPELPGPILTTRGTTTQAIYNVPYDLKAKSHPIAPLEIQITACTSPQEADRAVESSEKLTQMAPTQQRKTGDITLYEWDEVATDPRYKGRESHRIATRIGSFAVDITGASKPLVDNVYKALVHQFDRSDLALLHHALQ